MGDSTLLCKENFACLDRDDDGSGEMMAGLEFGDEEEYLEVLMVREDGFGVGCLGALEGNEWLVTCRVEAVRWILKTRACFGFSFGTAYLSVSYLDRFFVSRTIENRECWAVKLLSVACLSIAVKMEECRVPLSMEFQFDEYRFDGNSVQRMELLVLATLGWQMRSVTPFPCLSYLASKLECAFQPKELLPRATEVIFAALETMNLVEYRSSEIAMAAFFAVSGRVLTKQLLETEMGSTSICGSLKIEHVLSCYNLIHEVQRKKLESSKTTTSKDLTPSNYLGIRSSFDDSNETISPSRLGTKRRRLDLNT